VLLFRLALRALSWRAAASVTVFVVALIGTAAAAVGPIYLHAVDETVLAHRLIHAPQKERDLRIVRDTTIGISDVNWGEAIHALAGQAADPRWFDPPVYSEEAPVEWTGLNHYASEFAALDGLCAHVRIVAGRCLSDTSVADTVVTQRTAQQQHLTVGQALAPVPGGNSAKLPVRVVGIVAPLRPQGSYWAPWSGYLNAGDSVFGKALPRVDGFFVSHRMLAAHLLDVTQTLAVNLRLRPAAIRLDDLGPLRARIKDVEDAAARVPAGYALSIPTVGSGLPGVLDAMQKEMSLARTLVILPTAQLVLLAIAVLYAVVAGTAAASGNDVALAKLRGRRTGSVLTQGLAQPVLLVVIAAPIASLIAWGVVKLVAGHLLGGGVDVTFPAVAVQVVAVATAASVLAAAVAARRIIVSPVAQLLRRGGNTNGSSLGLLLADAAAVALAVAGVVELASNGAVDSGRTNPLSAVAPIVLGAALAVLVLRILPLIGSVLLHTSRDSRRVASFLAVRQIVRRPVGARVVVLLGVAIALATFAVVNWSVAATNRDQRALEQAGANSVLLVRTAPDVHDLRTAVDRADPSGRSMAAALVRVDRGTPLLAVDTSRFRGVAAWADKNSAVDLPSVLSRLAPRAAPSVVVAGTALRLDVDATKLPRKRRPTLSVELTGAGHVATSYQFGPVRIGHNFFRQPLGAVCPKPCRITGFTLQSAEQPSAGEIDAIVSASADGFNDPARWRSDDGGIVRLHSAGHGLGVKVRQSSPGAGWPTLLSADTPSHLPAVVAVGTAGTYSGEQIHDITSFGLDSSSLDLDGVATAVSLPYLDHTGVMIDFGGALNAMRAELSNETQLEVFAAASAPSDLAARLARQGVTVVRTMHQASFVDRLEHTGPAFADGLFLVAAAAAALLAIGATVLAGVTTARHHGYEFAALEVAGVRPRTLRRAAALEQLVLLVLGLLVGIIAGVVGAKLALPSTPVFVDQHIGPPIAKAVPYPLIAVLAAVLAAVFAGTSAGIARVVSHQATAGRLREAQA
jgi:putative ABC transport system permease protein